MGTETVMDTETTVLLTHPIGLHARPAVKLAQLVVTFDADAWVRLESGGEWVKARSTAQVLRLGARFGQRLQIGATGPESDSVVKAVADLFDRNFLFPAITTVLLLASWFRGVFCTAERAVNRGGRGRFH